MNAKGIEDESFSLYQLNEEISTRSNAAYHRAGITCGNSSAGCLAANFLFATIWKILAKEYWDGAFLHYTFLADDRIKSVSTAIGGLSPNALPQNRLLETLLKQISQAIGSVTLTTSSRLQAFTLATQA